MVNIIEENAYRDGETSIGFKTERINNMSQLSNYKFKYHSFIEQRLHRPIVKEQGYEIHHIIPKSLGGTNKKSNLVKLTYREHYIAHRMLVKMYKGRDRCKMSLALNSLLKFRNQHRYHNGLNARQFEYCKRQYDLIKQTSEYKEWRSECVRKSWTPERRKQQSEITKQQWKDGKKDHFHSEEYKLLKKQQTSHRWKDPAYQKKMSTYAKSQWQGGKQAFGR